MPQIVQPGFRLGCLLWLALALLTSCATPKPPPDPPIPPTVPAALRPPERVEPRASQPAFCDVLSGLIEAEREGFAKLRGRPLGAEIWAGQRTVPGTERCVVEGSDWPRARYECTGKPVRAAERDKVASQFALLSQQIDACLEKSAWFPRSWHRNAPFTFAMGEQQQTWTDLSSLPPSAVVLKMQRGLSGRDYRVQLDLVTIR